MKFDSTGSLIHDCARIDETAQIGCRVIIEGPGSIICAGSVIGSGSLIADNVTIGRGSVVKPGSVVNFDVPANAIVEGNPASVVGYTTSLLCKGLITNSIFKRSSFADAKSSQVSLPVSKCSFHLLRSFEDSKGKLTVGEFPSDLPFKPQRSFLVYNVPPNELRGEHAHKLCDQFLICISGSVRALIDDGVNRAEVILNSPDLGLYMPAKTWGTQFDYSSDACLLVFASLPYDPEDYLRSYDEFLDFSKVLPT